MALAAGTGIPADVLFHAEGWQQLPTALNKKNLLQDSTARALGLQGDPTVDDAFVALLLGVLQKALVQVTVTVVRSPAIAGVEVLGLTGLDGGPVYTDSTGLAVGFAPAGTVSLSTPEYQDLPASPVVKRQVAVGEIANVTLTVSSPARAGDVSLTSSTSGIRFSPYVTGVDVCCIGGGAGGSCGDNNFYDNKYTGGNGGGQGELVNSPGLLPDPAETYAAVVGAAGTGAMSDNRYETQPAQPGGSSSFMGITAAGGAVGGGGRGAKRTNAESWVADPGEDNTTHIFGDSSIALTGGAGGGSGCGSYSPQNAGASGGSPGGGRGCNSGTEPLVGEPGTSYGAGGGGGFPWTNTQAGGNGYQGLVRYRWRVA